MTIVHTLITRSLVGAALAGAGGILAGRALTSAPPGGRPRWERINHAGRTVSLLEGPAWAAGALCALPALPRGTRTGAALGVLSAATLGAIDDHAGATDVKGLRGHLTALRHGRVTTGTVKLAGLATTGLATTWLLDRGRSGHPLSETARTVAGGAVVAAAANLVNLFDLRPGRALKLVVLCAPATAAAGSRGGPLAACAAGASLALLPDDLAGRTMLGDTGANAAGALLGTAVVAGGSTPARLAALGLLGGLVLASERVSFTAVIARTPWLDAVDRWGRAA